MRTVSCLLLAILFLSAAVAVAAPPKVWVCPMADHPQEFDKPGNCPLCGMTLVEKGARLRVAVLVFPYAEDIDFTAPIEVLGGAGAQIFTVAATTDPITTVYGLHIRPDYDLAHAPASDLLLVPGGGVGNALKDDAVLSWVRQRAAGARYVMSVCNGAFILGKAGLLDGLSATTTAGRIDELAESYPKVHVVRARVVDNGKVITTAGLSAGIDGALHVIDREYGRTRAEGVARGIEYRWEPDSKWTRSAYADMRLPDISLPAGTSWERTYSRGDSEQWEQRGRFETSMTADEILANAEKQIIAKGWTVRAASKGERTFFHKDREGQSWLVTWKASPDQAAQNSVAATITIRKANG